MSETLTARRRAGHFLASEASFWRSRDHVLIGTGKLLAGTVLSRTAAPNAAGILVSRAKASNVGNGALTVDATTPVVAGGQVGIYVAVLTAAAVNGGTFTITDPLGAVVGTVAVGATFNNQIKFVVADGSTDFVVGDTFYLTVTRDLGVYGQLAPAGSGGAEVAYGVLWDDVDATTYPQRAVSIARQAEVDGTLLVWPAGITATQKATAYTNLLAVGIVVRD